MLFPNYLCICSIFFSSANLFATSAVYVWTSFVLFLSFKDEITVKYLINIWFYMTKSFVMAVLIDWLINTNCRSISAISGHEQSGFG
jgi:hypothetical protein